MSKAALMFRFTVSVKKVGAWVMLRRDQAAG